MSSTKREEFLRNWKSFPVAPNRKQRAHRACMRVARVEGSQIHFEEALVLVDENWSSILQCGDLVQVRDQEIEKLLVPSSRQKPVHWNSLQTEERWADFLRFVREHFWQDDFYEVTTPTLVASPGVEEYLHGFYTEFRAGGRKHRFALPTSPEFGLKKILAKGTSPIFEIKNCFRNEEIGSHHAPEFLMIEWYRAFATLEDLMDDTMAFVQSAARRFSCEVPDVQKVSVQEAFQKCTGVQIEADVGREDLAVIARVQDIHVSAEDSWNDLFFKIMLEKVEPYLESLGPVILHSYPTPQAALSRLDENGWAQRFELYWKGLEIANAFDELNDPTEQRRRFAETNRKRRDLGFEEMPLDEEFLQALEYGMPPSAGIALGLERLYMALFGIDEIRAVRSFTRLEIFVDFFFELFADFEEGEFLFRDADDFTSAWIATFVSFVMSIYKRAETANFNAVVLH